MSIQRGDERFVLSGTAYDFKLAPAGGNGFATANPMGSKLVQGERSYSDFDTPSVTALADFSGGIGQERLTDFTKYYSGTNVDTRAGQIILGPRTYQTGTDYLDTRSELALGAADATWLRIARDLDTTEYYVISIPFSTPIGFAVLYRIWVPLKSATTIIANIAACTIRDAFDGAILASGDIRYDSRISAGGWAEIVFDPVTLTAGGTYYLSIECPSGYAFSIRSWAYSTSSTWLLGSTHPAPAEWVEMHYQIPLFFSDPLQGFDAPPVPILGMGADSVQRMWFYAGSALYYIGSAGTPIVACYDNDSNPGTPVVPRLFGDRILDACWYADKIYLACGHGHDVVAFNGNIGAEDWYTLTATARTMAVHDDVLYLAENNLVVGFDGVNYGDPIYVGTSAYPIRRLISWQGYLYAGKDDGLYQIKPDATYPTGETANGTVVKALSFDSAADDCNFAFIVEHEGDLVFPIKQGLMRYTASGVLSSFAPETEMDIAYAQRGTYTAAASILETLWVTREAPIGYPSGILAYNNGSWHPVINPYRYGDMLRGLAFEPGLYGALPRLWFGAGLEGRYAEIPTDSARRWNYTAYYAEAGEWISSWIDGGLRTVNKKWLRFDIETYGVETNPGIVLVSYRTSDSAAWTTADFVFTANGVSQITLPTTLVATKLQLRLTLYSSTDGLSTPRVSFIGIRYLERFDNIMTYTRIYELSSRQVMRHGVPYPRSLAEQVADLETLRSSTSPLSWYPWWSPDAAITCYIMDIGGAEMTDEMIEADADKGTITVNARLMVV